MRVLLDTTHLLPAIGIAVHGISERTVLDLRRRGHATSVCTISLFELAAKGAKYVAQAKLDATRVLRGLSAVAADEALKKVAYEDAGVLALSLELRREITDFIDCLILAAALRDCEALVTEDEELRELAGRGKLRDIVATRRTDFRIVSAEELLRG